MLRKKSGRFLEIDALRGIAATFVLLFHLSSTNPNQLAIFRFGVTGVDLFFIISGFVISLTLEKTRHWKDFVLNRIARLYPVYWTAATLTFILIIINSQQIPLLQYVVNLTMFQHELRQLNLEGTYWSLNVEIKFYILMLGIFILKKLKQIEILGVFFLLITVCLSYFMRLNPWGRFLVFHISICDYWPLFFTGIIFYKMKFEKRTQTRYILLSICFIVQLFMFTKVGTSFAVLNIYEYTVALFLYYLAFHVYISGKLTFIINKFTVFLGSISYALYLIHGYLCINILMPKLTLAGFNFYNSALIAASISILIAYTITNFVEKPALHYIKSL